MVHSLKIPQLFSFLFVVFCEVQLQKHLLRPLITRSVLLLVLIPLSHFL